MKKKLMIFILGGLVSVCLLSGCGDSKTQETKSETTTVETSTEAEKEWKTDIYQGLALLYPSDWKVEPSKDGHRRYYHATEENFLMVQAANLGNESVNLQEISDDEMTQLMNKYYEGMTDTEITNEHLEENSGYKGFSFDFTQEINGKEYIGESHIVCGEQNMYTLVICYEKAAGNPYAKDYKKILNSLTIDNSVKIESKGETETTEEKVEESESGKVKKINLKLENGSFLKYEKHKIVEDYEGNPAIRIFFTFHNEDDDAQSIQTAFYPKVFQNSVQCEMAITMDGDDASGNSIKQVQKGGELECALTYKLNDQEGDVTLQVKGLSEMFNSSSGQEMTIPLK